MLSITVSGHVGDGQQVVATAIAQLFAQHGIRNVVIENGKVVKGEVTYVQPLLAVVAADAREAPIEVRIVELPEPEPPAPNSSYFDLSEEFWPGVAESNRPGGIDMTIYAVTGSNPRDREDVRLGVARNMDTLLKMLCLAEQMGATQVKISGRGLGQNFSGHNREGYAGLYALQSVMEQARNYRSTLSG